MNGSVLIRDISVPDTDTEFRSDVQLSTYLDDHELNRDLIKRFMFTRGSGGREERKGTAELLGLLRQTATSPGMDNRFVFIATYGHGKSHFGLAIANYFGQKQGSPELNSVLGKLDFVLPADQAAMFRQYREHVKPFLVVILRGDKPGSLRDGFFRALDESLNQHPQTKDLKPPFWFEAAEKALSGIAGTPAFTQQAEAFLSAHNLDLFSLQDMVQKRESKAYSLCVEVFKAVYGVSPDFGAETSMTDAVNWVTTTLCGPDKVFGGLLVLFDEFSIFIRDYLVNNPLGSPLQELMNGVSNNRGKALFIGLSQHDPNVMAERSGPAGADLLKELNRIPAPNRPRMQTMLEDVLGAYFRTDEEAWNRFTSQRTVVMPVADASELAYTLYKKRYGPGQMGWSFDVFQEKVAKQCFPLHPLTTALLSSVDLERSTSVRSVLNFVLDEDGGVRTHFDQPALHENGRPNWVLPTLLVDYFGEMLDEDKFKNFKNVFKPDLAEDQKAVLKAMLLLDISGLSTKEVGYEMAVAEMAGLTEAKATQTLKALEADHYIRRDGANKTYSFWVGSNGALELDRQLKENVAAREDKGTLHLLFSTYTANGNAVNNLKLTACHEVPVDWGNQGDWAAEEVLLPFSALKTSVLDALRAQYLVPIDKGPKARGVIVLVIPSTQAEADATPAKVKEILSASTKYETAPMLFVCPREPHNELISHLHKLAIMDELNFKSVHELKVGNVVYEEMKGRLRGQASVMLDRIRHGGDLLVPPTISGGLAARNITTATAKRLEKAMLEVYAAAYSKRPDSFFTQYKLGAPNLYGAVADVMQELLENNLDQVNWPAGARGAIPKDLVRLLQEHWGIISPRKQIVEPQHSRIKSAWERLDATFSPQSGKVLPAEVLGELLLPPYGYDQNTLGLLFAAWIGKNRTAIKLGGVGRLSRQVDKNGQPQSTFKKPADFLFAMTHTEISRKDMGSELAKIKAVLDAVSAGPLSQVEAKKAHGLLEEFRANNPRFETEYLENVERAAGKLKQGLENLDAYDKAVTEFEVKLSRATTVENAVPLGTSLSKLPPLTVVTSEKPGVDELRSALNAHILNITARQSGELSKLEDVGKFALREQQLKGMQRALKEINLPEARDQVERALADLQEAKNRLEAKQVEIQEMGFIKAIPTMGNLATLRDSLQNIAKLDPKSDGAATLADEKYGLVKAAIAKLEAHLLELPDLLDQISDVQAADKLRRQLLKEEYQYLGTPEADQVSEASNRADQLEKYFESVSGWKSLSTPAEAAEIRARLTSLPEDFKSALSSDQSVYAAKALALLSEQVEKLESQAVAWLQERRAQLENGKTVASLSRQLETPPAFLPESSRVGLEALKDALRSQLDAAAQEKTALDQVNALQETGSLVTLHEHLTRLDALPALTPTLAAAVSTKRERLLTELHRLEALPSLWHTQAAEVVTAQEADKLYGDMVRLETRFQGSANEAQIQALIGRVKEIEEILRGAESLRAKRETRLRDLIERRSTLIEALKNEALFEQQRVRLQKDILEVEKQYADQLARFESDLVRHSQSLEAATTVKATTTVVAELTKFPRQSLPAEMQMKLQQLETSQQMLEPLLRELEQLAGTTVKDLDQTAGALQRLDELAAQDAFSEQQQAHARSAHRRLSDLLAEKQQAATQWIQGQRANFDALAPEDSAGMSKIEEALRRPHAFLDVQGQEEIVLLQTELKRRVEESEVLQIEMLFNRIKSPELRQACLQRLTQLNAPITA